MITKERVKELFVALKLYYAGKYDFEKYNGKLAKHARTVNAKEEIFYRKITPRLLNEETTISFFVSNIIVNYIHSPKIDTFIGNYTNQESFKVLKYWKDWEAHYPSNIYQSLRNSDKLNEMFKMQNNDVHILNMILKQELNPFSVLYIIKAHPKLLENWKKNNTDTLFTQDLLEFLEKSAIFVKSDKIKVDKALELLYK